MNLLPKVKKMEIKEGMLSKAYILPYVGQIDSRSKKATEKLPTGADGAELVILAKETDSEEYTLEISENRIIITSDGARGAFYAIQTLRQIFEWINNIRFDK